MNEKIKRPRSIKLHLVTDVDGNKIYIKAKTKAGALKYIIGNHFTVEVVSPKQMLVALDDIAKGAEVRETDE